MWLFIANDSQLASYNFRQTLSLSPSLFVQFQALTTYATQQTIASI